MTKDNDLRTLFASGIDSWKCLAYSAAPILLAVT